MADGNREPATVKFILDESQLSGITRLDFNNLAKEDAERRG